MNALGGLLLALGAVVILIQINPDLLNLDVEVGGVELEVTLDEINFAITEQTVASVGTKYGLARPISSGVSDFAKNHGSSLNTITVDTSARQATFCAGSNCVSVLVNIGQGGASEIGQAQIGDLKTPKGTTAITTDIRIGANGNAVVVGRGFNVGPAFVNIGATANGRNRGIGFHGSSSNSYGPTQGCIRMNNADLAALAPYMKAGTKVIIK